MGGGIREKNIIVVEFLAKIKERSQSNANGYIHTFVFSFCSTFYFSLVLPESVM